MDLLPCLLDQRNEEPKKASGTLNFQFNGITVLSPHGSILPFETMTSRPTKHKVMGKGSKNFSSGALGITVVPLPFPLLDSWDL